MKSTRKWELTKGGRRTMKKEKLNEIKVLLWETAKLRKEEDAKLGKVWRLILKEEQDGN